jgi:very-short-patch-repair endonuclease
LIVEYDGAFHWEQRREDDRRREAMRALGWEVIVLSSEDYYKRRDQMLARVREALIRRRAIRNRRLEGVQTPIS